MNFDLHVRRQHNAKLPVSKLSDDLLWRIFKLNAEPLHMTPRFSSRASGQQVVAEVCYRWRTVALSAPTLWNELIVTQLTPLATVEEWIRRSAQVPLDLTLTSYDPTPRSPTPQPLQIALQQLSRTRVLYICMQSGKFKAPFWPNSVTAPLLEKLVLYMSPFNSVTQIHMRNFMKPLATKLPALRTVEIDQFHFKFGAWSLPAALTSLTWKGPSGCYTSLKSVLRVLMSFRHLQNLWLSPIDFDEIDNAQTTQTTAQITLPHLQTLALECYGQSGPQLLDHLIFPPLKSLRLELSAETYAELGAHPTFIRHIEAMVVPPRAIAAGFLKPEHPASSGGGFALQTWNEDRSLQHMRGALDYWHNPLTLDSDAEATLVSFKLTVDEEDYEDDAPAIKNLLNILPVSELETLFIRLDREFQSYPDVVDLFRRMKKLRTLIMADNNTACEEDGAVSAMSEILDPANGIVFPELRVFHLEDLYFRDNTQDFIDILKQRQDRSRIERLVLRDIHDITHDDFRDLCDVMDVDWDHKVDVEIDD